MLTARRLVAACLVVSVPWIAHAAATRSDSVSVQVARGTTTQTTSATVSGGGVKFLYASQAVGTDRFRTTVVSAREAAPLVAEISQTGMNTTVTCDLPGVTKVSPIEIRIAPRVTSSGGAVETTFAPGAPTYANVTFSAPRAKGESALGTWARTAATSPGTARRDVTVALKGTAGDVRTIVLRGAMPVLYSPLETSWQGATVLTALETLEVKVERVDVGGAASTFGGEWLGATLRGQDARADVTVTYFVAESAARTTRYTGSFLAGYKTTEITVGARGFTERWEIQPGPGAQPY
ncbi:MAG: hypothetical protein IPK71_35085 [Myxococcales bacterium]|nr:hypothetical protein [Myxococcales bacterium]